MHTLRLTFVLLTLLVIATVYLDHTEARGGGRGGGGRGRGGRGGRGGKGGRLGWKKTFGLGSSKYTDKTWRHAALAGHILGGPEYVKLHPEKTEKPAICRNKKLDNNETTPDGQSSGTAAKNIPEYFICPRPGDPASKSFCCGSKHLQYCCNETQAEKYYKRYAKVETGPEGPFLSLIWIIFIVAVIVVGACLVFFGLGHVCDECKERRKRRRRRGKGGSGGDNKERKSEEMEECIA